MKSYISRDMHIMCFMYINNNGYNNSSFILSEEMPLKLPWFSSSCAWKQSRLTDISSTSAIPTIHRSSKNNNRKIKYALDFYFFQFRPSDEAESHIRGEL